MSRFFSDKYRELTPYTPGEQPQERKYVKLNTNESPFPPSPYAQRLAREAAGDLQLYSDPECRSLVRTAAQVLGIAEDEIVFTNGSDEILNFCMMAFCDADHPAYFPDVTYGFYPVIAQLNAVPCRRFPLREDFTLNAEDYIGLPGGAIFLANPNAPTGIALPLEDVERIAAGSPDCVLVVDEAYVDFGAQSALGLIRKYPNLLVAQTFSKSRSLAGGRLGFGAACRELIADMNTIRYSTNPYNVNRMTMAAGIGALLDTDYFQKNCAVIQKNRADTVKELERLGFEVLPSSANFVFARKPGVSGQKIYLELKERGVLVRHFETERLRDYNRITIGSAEQMQALISNLEAIL